MVTEKKTLILSGEPASPGLTFGEARVVYSFEQTIEERDLTFDQVDEEINRLDHAVAESKVELEKLKDSAGKRIGGPVARIFESQLMIAGDPEFLKTVKNQIKNKLKCAEYIYSMMVESSIAPLKRSKDPYLKQMVGDIEAVSSRVIKQLTGQTVRHIGQSTHDCIFVGKIFTAAEILTLFERKVKAIITSGGGVNSHMALIARSLLIPTVIGVDQAHLKIKTGDRLIVDGHQGAVTVNPSESVWSELGKKKARVSVLQVLKLDKLPVFPPKTADTVEIEVAANIDLPGPVDRILSDHKVGIGLYRTEFIYLQNGKFPTEEQQYEIYDGVAERYKNQEVVIRTFDLGSDKYYKTDNMEKEANPALGWRGIRASFDMPIVFKNQIKAILRASTRGNVKLLLPMISDITELRKALRTIKRSMVELRKNGINFNQQIKIGIMIEIPSAVLAAENLAKKVDFFSIGSNDLTQYTLAADRENKRLAKIYNPVHPGVLSMIKMTLDAARKNNIPVSMCGEMAGDILAIPLLIGMGLNQLSMNPSKLYNACKLISKLRHTDTVDIAGKVLNLETLKEIENLLFDYNMSL